MNELLKLDQATRMLAEVQSAGDAKNLMDIASAAKHYAKKHGLGKEAVDYARTIEVSAEIKMGEYLALMEKNEGGDPVSHDDRVDEPPTLADMGISKNLSSEAQTLAELPTEDQEKVKSGKMSKRKGVNKVKQKKKKDKLAADSKKPIPRGITLYEGDIFDQLLKIPDKSIDLAIVDPPYMVLEEEWDTFKSLDEYLAFTHRWLLKVSKTMKDTGRMFIFFAPDYQYHLFQLLMSNNFFDMDYANTIIWVKKNNNKKFDRKRYRLTYEPIFHLSGKAAGNLTFPDETFGEIQTDVWTVATPQSNFKEGKYHPAQKPVEIYDRIVMTASNEGDTILDPFAGSGTAAIPCIKRRRKCFLIEANADNCILIQGRINGVERERV